MRKQNTLLFYILGIYVILQFAWWGYHLIELTEELKQEESEISKRVVMIIGEGLVFFMILLLGFWKIRSSIKKELQLTRRQNNFLLSVTHELKTPLAANKLYLQTILKRDPEEAKRKDLLEKAIQENERLEILIDNILNASRLENNALQLVRSQLDLSDMLNKLVDRFNRRSQKVVIDRSIEENIQIEADAFMIESAVSNLVDNALKYAGDDTTIEVYLFRNNNSIVFGVKDQGPGVTPEQRSVIFEKFFRAGNEETRQQKGSGLGLFIASEFIRIHGGKITCKENSPKGANFEITL